MTPDDLWDLTLPADMRLSPDGKRIAVVVERADRSANRRRAAIWLVDIESGHASQLTSGAGQDTSPRWSPDGTRLAFRRARPGKKPQIWVIPVDGGEPRQLTRVAHGASAPFWWPDGAWVGFESQVRGSDEAAAAPGPEESASAKQTSRDDDLPRIITRLVYRWDGEGYHEGRTHLFRVPAAGGTAETLTNGDFDDAEGCVSPDGRYLAFISDRAEDHDANATTDLWLKDLRTGAERLLTDGRQIVARPAWSPDGQLLAYLSEPAPDQHSYQHTRLTVADLASGALQELTEGSDRSARPNLTTDLVAIPSTAPVWSSDGRQLYFRSQRGGSVDILRVDAAGGPLRTVVTGDRFIAQFAVTPDTRSLIALQSDFTTTPDLWVYDLPGSGTGEVAQAPQCRLTAFNAGLLASRTLVSPERFTVTREDGREIEAWLARPPAAPDAPEERSPLVLWIHGGPHSAFGHVFYGWLHVLAGCGYAVLLANPRGSTGYGEAFAQGCEGDWGGGDYRDLMAALDTALARGGLDPARLAVTGVSYGGYMTNWIVGHTDRFKAAVTINSLCNLFSSFGTADEDCLWAGGYYGWPWDRPDYYRERSPITYATQMATPMRIIAAENDYRCPISQSEELYTWLKRLDRAPVDFVRFPNASHSAFATPRQRIVRLQLLLEWIERWVPAQSPGASHAEGQE